MQVTIQGDANVRKQKGFTLIELLVVIAIICWRKDGWPKY